ncbi:MAG: tRNA preQ1(34) S-adenosylmethionine ribosyltransferase-isomerase QueA [Deltaproteobacteria bacterium CG11_big_fil_rev_8_21_14_0_20_47_16]|nr:MAG: tRNA preQ1(34) S-adenosylmethionine ribosyltransferase-isomerase QueA [Deltaproteobacteria bacterium CG11_big_fil_rev_8_21_14_0_20_47_16]
MKLSDFDYDYPEALVAQHPLPQRELSRMMVINRSGDDPIHTTVSKLEDYLNAGDVLVLNTTKVLPVRLYGQKESGGAIEVLLLRKAPSLGNQWWCMATHTKRLKNGIVLTFSAELTATICDRNNDEILIDFQCSDDFEATLQKIGLPPLPPYIVRNTVDDYSQSDRSRYQTVFAQHAGSAAAPTAGLHLTDTILNQLRSKGITIAEVVLHVGRDTFQPVRVDSIADHQMHGEELIISQDTADIINKAKEEGRRIIAVGTTSVRALESSWDMDQGKLIAGTQTTQIFITPGYIFRVIDGLLTNFHQPKSTLIMLVSALLTRERVLDLYKAAIHENYRLFSFGDCMLII